MSSSWPKDGTSIVLLPDEPLGSKVLEAAKEWTRQRLLRPALYVTCSEQNSEVFAEYQPGNPLPILATVVGLNGHRQRNLLMNFQIPN